MAKMHYELESGATFGAIIIEDGPAAGRYRFNADGSLQNGKLLDLGSWPINGKEMNLKIDLEKNLPELLAAMNCRAEAVRARLAAESAAGEAQAELDRRMAKAGFSSGYTVIDKLNRFDGEAH